MGLPPVYGNLVVIGVNAEGKLWQAIRSRDHTTAWWSAFIDLENLAGERGKFIDISCARIPTSRDLHVCGVTTDGHLYHTIRFHDTWTWQDFGDIERQAGQQGRFKKVSCAAIDLDLHVCGVTTDGHLLHTIRKEQEWTWQDFADIERQAGERGKFIDVSCASIGNNLHVCGITDNGRLWHSIRYHNSWQDFADIERQAGERGKFVTVSCSPEPWGEVNDLHVCGVTTDGHLLHTIRKELEWTWQDFADIERQAGERGKFIDVSCDAVDNDVHFCGITADGGLWHTMRSEKLNRWQHFGNVELPAGERGLFVAVGIAGTRRSGSEIDDPFFYK